MFNLNEFIGKYQPFDEREAADKQAFDYFLQAFGDDVWSRNNLVGHISASAWVVNPERNKVLMAFHNIYHSWAWLGGHADGERDLLSVAKREAKEESGIKNLSALSVLPVDINVSQVRNHVKNDRFVPAHLHYNLTFLFEAGENEVLNSRPDENSDVKWIGFGNIAEECKEDYMLPVYQRLMKKAITLK